MSDKETPAKHAAAGAIQAWKEAQAPQPPEAWLGLLDELKEKGLAE